MPKHVSYKDPTYRLRQAALTKEAWQKGIYNFKRAPLVTRQCQNPKCQSPFQIKPYEANRFCSRSCAAKVTNQTRIISPQTRQKRSATLKLLAASDPNFPLKIHPGARKSVTKVTLQCLKCGQEFQRLPYIAKKQKFCSTACAMYVTGRLTTSPKASKGKSGVRPDISSTICFYSTWEANIARFFNLIGITWMYAPAVFDIGGHTYRPDFYLPQDNMYIEVKNFMGEYSANRDKLFRERYPYIKLELILKLEYKLIEEQYKPLIDNWET